MINTTTFAYAGFHNGRRVRGMQSAVDRDQALEILQGAGLNVSKCERHAPEALIVRKVIRKIFATGLSVRVAFFRAYAALESKGVPFNQSFPLLIKTTTDDGLRQTLIAVRESVTQGMRLSEAMAQHPDSFTSSEIAMIAAGEQSKGRAQILDRLATVMERDAAVRKKLIGALTYPSLLILGAIALFFFAILWLIPMFGKLYVSFDVTPPSVMVIGLAIGSFITNPIGILVILGVVAGLVFLMSRYASTAEGAYQIDKLLLSDGKVWRLKLWPIGAIRRKAVQARVARTFGALLESGVPLARAFEAVIPVCESPVYAQALRAAAESLRSGETTGFAEALRAARAMDEYALGFVEIGERATQVPDMLGRLAVYYDEDVEQHMTTLPEKLQTVVLLFLGVVVSYVMYLVYIPIATLNSGIH